MRRACGLGAFLLASAFCLGQTGTAVIVSPSSQDSRDRTFPVPATQISGRTHLRASLAKAAPADADTESAGEEIPTYTLEFKQREKQSGGVPVSPLIVLPVRCSSDGTPFFRAIDLPVTKDQPFDPVKQTVYSITADGGAHLFTIQALYDLDNVRFGGMDADGSTVVFLVYARKRSDIPGVSGPLPAGVAPKTENYLAFFDHDGGYKRSVKIGVDQDIYDIALLSSGEIAILGYDKMVSAVRVSLLDTDGEFIKPILFSDDIVSGPALRKAADTSDAYEQARAVVSSGIGSWRFAHVREKILLYQPDSKAPVLEIGTGGVKREIPVSIPKGYRLDAFLPSNDRLIARFREVGQAKPTTGGDVTSFNNFAFFELNPSDGSLRYRIDLGKGVAPSSYSIACERDGTFLAFESEVDANSKDAKLILLNASVGR